MTAVIALASELLGPMLDAAGDPAETSSRSLRFATLLERDPQLARQLTDPELDSSDVEDAPLTVWAWWLDWRRQRSTAPPPAPFLNALFHASADPLIRLRVVQSETWHPEWIARYQDSAERRAGRLDSIPAGFVGDGVRRAIHWQVDVDDRDLERTVREPQLELGELSTHLLQLGDRWSLAVLEAILTTQWEGSAQLVERFGPLLRSAQDQNEFED
jgi:hypothetical protein